MIQEYIHRIPVTKVIDPSGIVPDTEMVSMPLGAFWTEEIGTRYDGHALVRARYQSDVTVKWQKEMWASPDDLLTLDTDLAHLHGFTEPYQVMSGIIPDLDTAKKRRTEQLSAQTSARIYLNWPQYKQINVALGLYDEETGDACRDCIKLEAGLFRAARVKIQAAVTVTEVLRVCLDAPDASVTPSA